MEEIPDWQCGPEGGNWEHMGQIRPKLTEGEHEKWKKKEKESSPGEKSADVWYQGVSVWLVIFPLLLRLLTVTLSPQCLLGHFGWVHCSITSFNSIVPTRDACFAALIEIKYEACSWIIRASKQQNNKQVKDREAGRETMMQVLPLSTLHIYKHFCTW